MGLGSGIRDPGSGKNLFRIPDPGVKKGTGSRIPDPQPALQDLTALYLENLKTYFEELIDTYFG